MQPNTPQHNTKMDLFDNKHTTHYNQHTTHHNQVQYTYSNTNTHTDHEADAKKIIKLAEKEIASIGIIDDLFGAGKKKRLSTACKYYEQAANKYKQATMWENAGDMFATCATTADPTENYYTLSYHKNAIECYTEAPITDNIIKKMHIHTDFVINSYLATGKFADAATMANTLADFFVKNNRLTDAVAKYTEANKYYISCTGNSTSYSKPLTKLKLANTLALIKKYPDALEHYNDLIYNCCNGTMQYKINDIWISACICMAHMDDLVALRKAASNQSNSQHNLNKISTCNIIDSIVYAIENSDSGPLTKILPNCDSWQRLALSEIIDRLDSDNEEENFC